jgi:hypothetical protein
MKKQRTHNAPEEKVAIVRKSLLEQVPISELWDQQGLQPTVFYRRVPRSRPSHVSQKRRDLGHPAPGGSA